MFPDWLLWFPVIVFAAMIPLVCFLDIAYREIPHSTWLTAIACLLPFTAWMYLMGFYQLELIAVSVFFVVLYFVAMKVHIFEGADFVYLSLLSVFFVQSPLTHHVLMPLVLFEMLLCITIVCNGVLFMFKERAEQFPMVLIISGAFFMAVMLG